MCIHVLMEVCIFTEHVACCVLPTVNTELDNENASLLGHDAVLPVR